MNVNCLPINLYNHRKQLTENGNKSSLNRRALTPSTAIITGEFCSKEASETNRYLVSFGLRAGETVDYRTRKYSYIKPDYPRNLSVLKNLHDAPCIYCGMPIMSNKERHRLSKEIAELKGDKLIDKLKSNQVRKYLRHNKLNIVDSLCRQAKLSPELNLQELLIKLAPNYVNRLEMEQISVLNNINKKFVKRLKTEEEQSKLYNFIDNQYNWIKFKNSQYPFKRKAFLADLKRLLEEDLSGDKKLNMQIFDEAIKMPKSFESESAFIVKYSRREPNEIANQLFYDAKMTVEHIKTQSTGGETLLENLALSDAYCNNVLRKDIPMKEFYHKYPKIKQSLEKYLDRMLKEGFGGYASDIAKTYTRESENTLDLKKYIRKE